MPAVMPKSLRSLAASETDPKSALLRAIGSSLDKVQVFGAQVLVGTYIAPDKTTGGVHLPDSYLMESLYQGNVGLVLKKGPWAFQNDDHLNIDWKGQDVDVGQWVMFRYSDAWELHLSGVSVRLIDDRDIKAVIDSPLLLTSKANVIAAE